MPQAGKADSKSTQVVFNVPEALHDMRQLGKGVVIGTYDSFQAFAARASALDASHEDQ